MDRKPDITDEDVGMHAFHLRKRQVTERAMEKVRQGLGRKFLKYTQEDIELLEYILGETWAMMGFHEWEHVAFSTLTDEDLDYIINIAREITSHKKMGVKGVEEIHVFLNTKTGD